MGGFEQQGGAQGRLGGVTEEQQLPVVPDSSRIKEGPHKDHRGQSPTGP